MSIETESVDSRLFVPSNPTHNPDWISYPRQWVTDRPVYFEFGIPEAVVLGRSHWMLNIPMEAPVELRRGLSSGYWRIDTVIATSSLLGDFPVRRYVPFDSGNVLVNYRETDGSAYRRKITEIEAYVARFRCREKR